MEIKLKISGQSKQVDGVWLAEGKSEDGRKVYATLVQKGSNLVLQTAKQGKNQIGECRATSWFGKGIVLKDSTAKAGATVTFTEVHADEIYIEKFQSEKDKYKELAAQVEKLAKINQSKDKTLQDAMKQLLDLKAQLAATGEAAANEQ